jgi:hypothetical protein
VAGGSPPARRGGRPRAGVEQAGILLKGDRDADGQSARSQAGDRANTDAAGNLGLMLKARGNAVGAEAAFRRAAGMA